MTDDSSSEKTPVNQRRARLLPGFALVILAAVVLFPVSRASYLWLDETTIGNVALQDDAALGRIWSEPGRWLDKQPLTQTYYWVQVRTWANNPPLFHVCSLLIHCLTSVLLWRVFEQLNFRGAWLAAAVFAVHPVQVEAVVWLSAVDTLLAGFFFVAALNCFAIGSCEESGIQAWVWQFSVLLSFGLGLLCNVSLLALPPVLLVVTWLRSASVNQSTKLSLSGLMIGALLLFVMQAVGGAGQGAQTWDHSLGTRLLVASQAFWFYLAKLSLPGWQAFGYGRWQIDNASYGCLAGLIMLLTILGILAFRSGAGRGWKAPFAAAVTVLLLLAPTFALTELDIERFSYVADRHLYLACGVWGALISAGIWAVAMRLSEPHGMWVQRGSGTAGLLLLGLASWNWSHQFVDQEGLYLVSQQRYPRSVLSYLNVGLFQLGRGEIRAAREQFRKSMALEDQLGANLPLTWIGHTYAREGAWSDAIRYYRQAIKLDADLAETHDALGEALLRIGARGAGIAALERALELAPNSSVTHLKLGKARYDRGELNRAQRHVRSALEFDPGNAEAHFVLAQFLAEDKQTTQAIEACQTAISLVPDNVRWHRLLASLLATQGQYDLAVEVARYATDLAASQGNRKRYQEARAMLERYEARLKRPASGSPAMGPIEIGPPVIGPPVTRRPR